jgi:hypothetical protein
VLEALLGELPEVFERELLPLLQPLVAVQVECSATLSLKNKAPGFNP